VFRSIVLAAVIFAANAWALPPPGHEKGAVYDAATHLPLAGVVITAHVHGAHNPKNTEFNFAPYEVVSVTDSLGRYFAGYLGVADVVYTAAGYDTLRLRWPDDLSQEEPCAGLIDVYLTRSRDVKTR